MAVSNECNQSLEIICIALTSKGKFEMNKSVEGASCKPQNPIFLPRMHLIYALKCSLQYPGVCVEYTFHNYFSLDSMNN